MQGVGKIASLLLTSAAACALLTACHGSSSSTTSTTPPTVGTFTCQPGNQTTAAVVTGIPVTCTSTGAISADGSAVGYNWNFGDQTLSTSTQPTTGNPVTHYYAQPGSYQVILGVVDDHGSSATRIKTITVTVPAGSTITPDGVENWAWLSGLNTANSSGDYQTQFTPSALNQPGARQNASSWTDAQGVLWMFGGSGLDSAGTAGYLNDLWKFDPKINQWAWISGSNKANATGTFPKTTTAIPAPGPNDTAATNVISARSAAATWTSTDASGKVTFWLFGGTGYDINGNNGYLNDLWMLNSQSGEATWEAGSGVANSATVVGTQGIASSSNAPSGRSYASTWVQNVTDSNNVATNVLWLFGGQMINSSGTVQYLNDLWSYDPNPVSSAHPNGQMWILVSAQATATTTNAAGIYGTQNTPSRSNYPGARVGAQTWVDASGNLWLFGGDGFDTNDINGALNDLWSFNIANQTWTFVSGSTSAGASSVYGPTKGSTAATSSSLPNTPGARLGTSGWFDPTTKYLWLFGGSGTDSTNTTTADDGGGALNELWVFIPNAQGTNGVWAWMGGVNIAGTAGVYTTPTPALSNFVPQVPALAIPPSPANSSNYSTPGSRVWSTSWVVKNKPNTFYLFGGSGLDSVGTSGYLNDLWTVQISNLPVIAPITN